jgi:large subunit ribosomal protein L22
MAKRKKEDDVASYRAIHRNVRMSPRKAYVVMGLIRGLDVQSAMQRLQFTKKRAAYFIDRVLRSAVANADQTGEVDVDRLYVATATVDQARTLKRWRPGAMGRAGQVLKRNCHLEVVLRERADDQ